MKNGKTTPWRVTVVPPRKNRGEASLYLRSRRMRDGREEEQRDSAKTLDWAVAEAEARKHEAAMNASGRTLPAIMDARIADLERAAARGHKSPDSVVGFRNARARLAPLLAVEEVTRAELLHARDALVADGLGPEAINTYLRRAAACWRWAEERGLVSTPWPRVKALPKPPRKKRPYTPAEVAALLGWVAAHAPRWHALLCLVDDTGRRVSEVCRLRGRDLDRDEGTVRVRQKGRRDLVLPVSPEVLALLPERAPSEWLFPRRQRDGKTGPAHRDAVRRVVRRAIRALEIPDGDRLDVHSLRRSFAADGSRAGLPNDVVRRLSGHETEAMLGHYQRDAVGDDLREAQERIRAYRETRRASPAPSPNPGRPASQVPATTGSRGARASLRGLESESRKSRTRKTVAPDRSGEVGHPEAPTVRYPSPGPREAAFLALGSRWADECPALMDWLTDEEDATGRMLMRAGMERAGLLPAKKGGRRAAR